MLNVLDICHSLPVVRHCSGIRLRIRFRNVVTIVQPFTKMLMSLPNHVIGNRAMEAF